MLHFYIATTKQLPRCLPLNSALLRCASSLHPVDSKTAMSLDMIEMLAKSCPQVINETQVFHR